MQVQQYLGLDLLSILHGALRGDRFRAYRAQLEVTRCLYPPLPLARPVLLEHLALPPENILHFVPDNAVKGIIVRLDLPHLDNIRVEM